MSVQLVALAFGVAVLAGCSSGPSHPHTTAVKTAPTSAPGAQQQAAVYPSPSACPSRAASPAVRVTLTDIEGRPSVPVRLHATFEVIVHGSARVTTPIVTPAQAVCLVRLSPSNTTLTATYYSLRPGHLTIAATITWVPGGINHPLYGGTFTVR